MNAQLTIPIDFENMSIEDLKKLREIISETYDKINSIYNKKLINRIKNTII